MLKNLNLIGKASQLMFAVLIGGLVGSFFDSQPIAYLVFAILCVPVFLNYRLPKAAFFQSLDISQLVSVLGAYCQENRNILTTNVLLDDMEATRFNVLEDVTDEVPLPNLDISDIVKPADPTTFSPTTNALKFGARILRARACKVDLQLIPQILEKSWLGKTKSPTNPIEMPFEEFIMNYIIQKAKENIRLNAIYQGVYNASGSTSGATMDGFDTLLAAEIAASNANIVGVTTGTLTSSNIAVKLQLIYDSLGEAFKNMPVVADLAPQHFDWYVRLFQPVINPTLVVTNGAAAMQYPVVTEVPLIGTNAMLRREPGKPTTSPIFFTPKENLYKGIDSSVFNIDVQKFDRTIKILMDFKVGVNFGQTFNKSISYGIVP